MPRRRATVRHTAEFDRIAGLPRRVVTLADAEAWAAALTPEFRQARPRNPEAHLLPAQGIALAELAGLDDHPRRSAAPGALLGYPVGTGKTLFFELAPLMVGAERPVLLMPSGMRGKTLHERGIYLRDWKIAAPRVIGDRELILNPGMLDVIDPDLLLLEECDTFANLEASAPAQIDKFVVDHWDTCRVVAATGTLGRNSILDYWHLAIWCLKDDAPVPHDPAEADMWARALDNARRGGRLTRPDSGPLGPDLASARTWYRRRLSETPGVIVWDHDSAANVPLRVNTRLARECPKTDDAFRVLLTLGENPAGVPVATPLDQYRMDEQVGSGLCQYWDPPPPKEWRDARRASAAFCRRKILSSRDSRRPLYTEGAVLKAYADHPIVADWLEQKPKYDPAKHTRVRWISDAAIESCVEWLAERDAGQDGPGIIWTGSVEFGEALARRTGLSYYGQAGRDQFGGQLFDAPPGRHLIASHKANKRGYNLQAWARQLLCQMPTSAKYLEQTFGRGHRHGQRKAVIVDVLVTSGGTLDALERALAEAGFNRDTVGLTQKILRAGVSRVVPTTGPHAPNRYRWARGEERFTDTDTTNP